MAPQLAQAAEGVARDKEIQQPLTLVMPLDVDRVEKLKELLKNPKIHESSTRALQKVGTVHSTRFVILEDTEQGWAKLAVLAIYDGSFEAYIRAFARELNDVFNTLLRFVEDAPPLPVQHNVPEFIDYIRDHDVKPAHDQPYSAYPELTVLDIYEATRRRPDAAASVRP